MLSARFARTAIGYVAVSGNDGRYSLSFWLKSTGHDSPGGTNPVSTSRLSVSVLPGGARYIELPLRGRPAPDAIVVKADANGEEFRTRLELRRTQ